MKIPNPFNNERKDGSCAWRITLSEHEWTWTQEEQEEMARVIIQLSAALTKAEQYRRRLTPTGKENNK